MAFPIEVDSIEIRVLVNDQLDNNAASWNPEVQAPGRLSHMPLRSLDEQQSQARGGAKAEISFANSCCGAHGLSLLITATKGETKHTLLFDTGPEGFIWRENVQRLKLNHAVGQVEAIHLSHWHCDHSGGLLEAIRMITNAKAADAAKVKVCLHPDRPNVRGAMTPFGPVSLEPDPTFEEIKTAGGEIILSSDDHLILDDMFFVSGEIPRTTEYETGFAGGIRLTSVEAGWQKDELILDERFVMCNLRGKGLVVFTGCGHAGVVNTTRRAVEVGGGTPLSTVLGGFHLTDANKGKIEATVEDLKALDPKVLMPGHCSGWRFSVEAEKIMPGAVVPLFGGQVYRLSA